MAPSTQPAIAAAAPTISTTTATTEHNTAQQQTQPPVLRLRLAARPTVRWDESVVNNEGMGRKSSKRCCIFHKQREFGESSTDSSDNEGGNGRKIARKKTDKPKDFQRYHA